MVEKKKVKVNIIYSPQSGPAKEPRFVNEKGELWMNPHRVPEMHNVSMSFYSAAFPYPQGEGDSIYVIEPRVITGGERDYDINFINRFKYVFTWATKAFEGTDVEKKMIPLKHPSCLGVNESVYEACKKRWYSWNQRTNEIVFIANNKKSDHPAELYSFRIKFADWIYKNHPTYKVSWFSQIPVKRPYYRGKIEDKTEVLKKAKFTVCTENCYDPKFSHNYFTEKLPESWLGGGVPLYIGCYNIDDFNFSKDSYVDLRRFLIDQQPVNLDFPAIVRELDTFNKDKYAALQTGIDHNIYQAKLFDHISEYKVMEKMIDVFYNE